MDLRAGHATELCRQSPGLYRSYLAPTWSTSLLAPPRHDRQQRLRRLTGRTRSADHFGSSPNPFKLISLHGDPRRSRVARKTVRVSDISGQEIPDGRGALVRITFADARRGSRELDVTDAEAEKLGGRQVARRGRKPKTA